MALGHTAAMTSHPTGTFAVIGDPTVQLRTGRIGLTRFEFEAPITGGTLILKARSSELILELDLAQVRAGNSLMQGAVRSLVGSGDNSNLRFDAKGAADDLMRFTGTAQAGDVIVPMEVNAALAALTETLPVTLTGWARFTDVHIPLPGMSRVNTLEVDVNSSLEFVID
jgi:hypothetical protein